MTSSFWKTAGVVFVVVFAANVLVAWLWSLAFPGSSWSWDTSTTSAVIIAVATTWLLRRPSSR